MANVRLSKRGDSVMLNMRVPADVLEIADGVAENAERTDLTRSKVLRALIIEGIRQAQTTGNLMIEGQVVDLSEYFGVKQENNEPA
jgi:hypothetical protein